MLRPQAAAAAGGSLLATCSREGSKGTQKRTSAQAPQRRRTCQGGPARRAAWDAGVCGAGASHCGGDALEFRSWGQLACDVLQGQARGAYRYHLRPAGTVPAGRCPPLVLAIRRCGLPPRPCVLLTLCGVRRRRRYIASPTMRSLGAWNFPPVTVGWSRPAPSMGVCGCSTPAAASRSTAAAGMPAPSMTSASPQMAPGWRLRRPTKL
jgi:hypothetical protein